ncbi:MAG: GspH/FimT family pseudopilin [Burkholderiales bacterium]
MLIFRRHLRGFSLIEMMVGLVIVGILLATGLPSIRTWLNNTKIRNAAEAIQNGLQQARAAAVQHNGLVVFTLGAGSSWTVGCAVVVAGTCPAIIESRSSLEGSTNVSVAADQAAITFNGLGRASFVVAGVAKKFVVTMPNGGTCVADGGQMRCLNVAVSNGGQIHMCDPAIVFSNTAPQGCTAQEK